MFLDRLAVFHPSVLLVKGRIAGVEILGVKIILRDAEGIAEPLIVNYLAGAKELDRVVDVGIVRQAENIVVGGAGLLLCYYHVFAMFLVFQKTRKILMFQGFRYF